MSVRLSVGGKEVRAHEGHRLSDPDLRFLDRQQARAAGGADDEPSQPIAAAARPHQRAGSQRVIFIDRRMSFIVGTCFPSRRPLESRPPRFFRARRREIFRVLRYSESFGANFLRDRVARESFAWWRARAVAPRRRGCPRLDGAFATTGAERRGDAGRAAGPTPSSPFVAGGHDDDLHRRAAGAAATPRPPAPRTPLLGPADGQSVRARARGERRGRVPLRAHPRSRRRRSTRISLLGRRRAGRRRGVVEVSADGESFAASACSAESDQSFSLARVGASAATFVRISNTGAASCR